MHWVIDTRYAGPLLDRLVADPDRTMRDSGVVLKHDRTTTVVRVADDGGAWVVKRYNTKNAWHALRRTLRTSRAANCWSMSERFRQAGVGVAPAVACIERRAGLLRGRSYFVCELIDAPDLLSYLGARPPGDDTEAVIGAVREVFQAMRRSKINHGDMKATNLLVGADAAITLLDLDAARANPDEAAFERAYARDRSRFLKNWVHRPELRGRFDRAIPG